MYVIDATASVPSAVEVERASATRQLATKALSGDFTIDVVSSQHLTKHLDDRVNTFAQGVADLAAQASDKFLTARGDPGES